MRSTSELRSHYNGNRSHQQQQRPPQRNQTVDSRGPDVRIRGTAHQIFERYIALAREAMTAGDRVAAENLYQHAEHYFRMDNASREGSPQSAPRPITPADSSMGGPDQEESDRADLGPSQPGWRDDRPGFI